MKKTNNKGITLIALVITIIVLLILAGVSIAMLTGSNGVLTKARQSEVMNKRGEVAEKINLALNAVETELLSSVATSEDGTSVTIPKENDIKTANGLGDEYKINFSQPDSLPGGEDAKWIEIKWTPKATKYGDSISGYLGYNSSNNDISNGKIPFEITPASAAYETSAEDDGE